MIPYIENEYGIKYELSSVTRKQKVQIVNEIKNRKQDDVEALEKLAFKLVQFSNPQLTEEEWEKILDYNERTYGFNELYELLGALIEDVFTLQGGEKKVHPYLQMKKAAKQPVPVEPTHEEQAFIE